MGFFDIAETSSNALRPQMSKIKFIWLYLVVTIPITLAVYFSLGYKRARLQSSGTAPPQPAQSPSAGPDEAAIASSDSGEAVAQVKTALQTALSQAEGRRKLQELRAKREAGIFANMEHPENGQPPLPEGIEGSAGASDRDQLEGKEVEELEALVEEHRRRADTDGELLVSAMLAALQAETGQ
jgi:hypothetical protein